MPLTSALLVEFSSGSPGQDTRNGPRMTKARVVAAVLLALTVVSTSCGGAVANMVADGSYRALVPSSVQFEQSGAEGIPGGFAVLRSDGVDSIGVIVDGDDVTFVVDGQEVTSLRVRERRIVVDSEGSGPFKGQKEVLILGGETLTLAGLTIDRPVIWPGSFEGSPVITVKSEDPDERGPVVSCGADEACLILSSNVDPAGRYEDANNPELNENPVAVIVVAGSEIVFTLDSGEEVRTSRQGESLIRSCGLAETFVWDVPRDVGLTMNDPVLVQAACPTTPGDTVLHIFERSDMPVLVPFDASWAGEWCRPSADCLMFVPAP